MVILNKLLVVVVIGGGGGSHLCRCSFNSTQLLFFAFSTASALTYSLTLPRPGFALTFQRGNKISRHGATAMEAVSLFEVFFLMLIISFFYIAGFWECTVLLLILNDSCLNDPFILFTFSVAEDDHQ